VTEATTTANDTIVVLGSTATLSIGAIVGIAVGGGGALLLIGIVVVAIVLRTSKKRSELSQPPPEQIIEPKHSVTDSGTELKPAIGTTALNNNKSIYSGIGGNAFFDFNAQEGVYTPAPAPASVYEGAEIDDDEGRRKSIYTNAPPPASVYGEGPSLRSTIYIPPESPLDE
jgi:hypothetical protein